MKRIFNSIHNSSLVKNTLKLSASNVAMMFLPLIVTPILSRLYTPEEYGAWGVFSSMMFIVNSFMFLSYENAIVRSKSEEEIPQIIVLCLSVSFFIVFAITCIYLFGITFNIGFFEQFPAPIWFFITLIVSLLNALLLCICNRIKVYGKMSLANIINGVGQASIRVILGLAPIIAYGLIVGNVVAHLLAVLFLLHAAKNYLYTLNWKRVSLANIKDTAFRYKKFPVYDAPARFLEFTIGNIIVIVLSYFYESEQLGCYAMIIQFILLPISVVGSAMGTVYYREVSEAISQKKTASTSTISVLKISFLLSILPMLLISMGGDKILVIILGEQWIEAGKMSLYLVIYSAPVILTEPLLPAFRALDMQDIRLKYNLINITLSLCTLILTSIVLNNIYLSLLLYSIAYAFVRFLMFRQILGITKTELGRHFPKMIILYVVCYMILAIRLIINIL